MNKLQWQVIGLLPYAAFYAMLILVHGYAFGSNDQMDFMPYARHIQDASLYPNDFYINCIGSRFNERWFLANSIALIPAVWWPIFFLVLHAVSTILLVRGLIQWARLYFQSVWLQWLCVFIPLILLYNRNLGGNELYYNMVCASLLAKSIAIWALYHAYKSNLTKTILLTVLATYLHPIVGAQVFILAFILITMPQKTRYTIYVALLIIPYLYVLFNDLDHTISGREFVHIMYLRNAHHFFPGSFGMINYMILLPFGILGTKGLYTPDRRIFYICIAIIVGCLVYSIGMELFPKLTIISQWFKTTIWLKFFCTIGLIHLLTNFQGIKIDQYHIYRLKYVVLTLITLLVSYKTYRNFARIDSEYQLPFSQPGYDIQAAFKAKIISTGNDIFLVPPDFTSFKYYSERSTYADWKAIPHNGNCLLEWRKRIYLSYGLTTTDRTSLNHIYARGNDYLSGLMPDQKTILRSQGVTYIVFRPKGKKEYSIEKL